MVYNIYIYYIILRLLLSVRLSVCVYEREVTGRQWTRAKKFSFLALLNLER